MSSSVYTYMIIATAASIDEGEMIGQRLLQARLAACSNLIPGVTSIFRWQGKIEKDSEVLLLIKTTEDKLSAAMDLIREIHSYDVPEILAIPVHSGNPDYLDWVAKETRD